MTPFPPFRALLAVADSDPAPPGRTSAAGVAIIVLCFTAALALAVRGAVKRFRCGGPSQSNDFQTGKPRT